MKEDHIHYSEMCRAHETVKVLAYCVDTKIQEMKQSMKLMEIMELVNSIKVMIFISKLWNRY